MSLVLLGFGKTSGGGTEPEGVSNLVQVTKSVDKTEKITKTTRVIKLTMKVDEI